jgi:hypothetical protein
MERSWKAASIFSRFSREKHPPLNSVLGVGGDGAPVGEIPGIEQSWKLEV